MNSAADVATPKAVESQNGLTLLPPTINKSLDILYGDGAADKVGKANVLVVGAGGVGCELLKNLAFNGFRKATVIDLDTIDVSNLNRQFLFRREHVGKSKAEMAADAIRKMQPNITIEGIVANIKDPRFDVNYFKSYTIVCNALDNLDARRHVNRMCLAAGIPLIESGSTGYNGQVSIHAKGYECYDCVEKKPQKSFAVCTIRSTPEKPVHCIVWAKSLWDLIFGPDDDGNVLADLDGGAPSDAIGDGEHSNPTGDKDLVIANYENAPKKPPKRIRYAHPEPTKEFANRVCARIFVDDIAEQAAMKSRWKTRPAPTTYDVPAVASAGESLTLDKVNLLEQRVWEREECARVLYAVLQHMVDKRKQEIGNIPFDKDDNEALAFVVAAANLRAEAYGVKRSSPFEVKGIAGNIVHAIATTNAVVGGLVVQEALKVVTNEGSVENCFPAYVNRIERGSRVRTILNPSDMQKPKPNCYVCSKGQLLLTIDTEETTLKMLVENVLIKKLSVTEPNVYLTAGDHHNTLFESGEGLDEDEIEMYTTNMNMKLSELQVNTGAQLSIDDTKTAMKCVIHVEHKLGCEADKPVADRFLLSGATPVKGDENGVVSAGVHSNSKQDEVEDVDANELEIVEPSANGTEVSKSKNTNTEVAVVREETEKSGFETKDSTKSSALEKVGNGGINGAVDKQSIGNRLKRKSDAIDEGDQQVSKRPKENSIVGTTVE